jgi:hypothetical protein
MESTRDIGKEINIIIRKPLEISSKMHKMPKARGLITLPAN